MRPLFLVLAGQLVLAAILLILVATGSLNFTGGASTNVAEKSKASGKPSVDRFDENRAWDWLVKQVEMGPRPAGSKQSRALGDLIKKNLPGGKFQSVPGGLRNVIGTTPGKDPRRYIVVGAHYDTKDIPGFVGAEDGAGGTAALLELARDIKPKTVRPTIVWIAFDGEETPAGVPDDQFLEKGVRGSKVAAKKYKDAKAMVLLDFIAQKDLSTPREANSDIPLWGRLRTAARKVGTIRYYPNDTFGGVEDDHTPFYQEGVPSIDLIDFTYDCWHKTCDDLKHVSKSSLNVSGETVRQMLVGLP
jgi:glutaminyl-peptide cyclotransferase